MKALKKPNKAGWWWCIPDKKCEWYRDYPKGVVCQVVASDGGAGTKWFDPEDVGRLSIDCTFCHDFIGFTGEYTADVFGKWYGPLDPPKPA
jgi:hypothetical protein